MIIIAWGRDGRLEKILGVATIKKNANYYFFYGEDELLIQQLSRHWIIKLEVL